MSRHISSKCLTCSHLTAEEARRLHGLDGDQCWDDLKCHKRRSHYRNRSERNLKRVISRQSKSESDLPEIIRLPTGFTQVAPFVTLYVDDPHQGRKLTNVHAVGAELWIDEEPQVRIEPIHCFSLSVKEFNSLARQILKAFSDHYGNDKEFKVFTEAIYRDKLHCPIRPCPLYS